MTAFFVLLFVALAGCLDDTSSENSLPVPVITVSKTFVNQNELFNYSGEESEDSDGRIVTFSWDFGDGTTSSKAYGTHKYDENGIFNITLIITDNGDAKAITNKTIKVNSVPTARIFVENPTVKVYQSLDFIGSGSTDPDGLIFRYLWDFGDGSVSTSADPKHVFNEVGSFTVTLTVADENEASDSTSIDIEVVSRLFMITYSRENETRSFNDFTREEDTTNKTHDLSQVNLLKVEVTLEWDDDFPFTIIENESTPDPDTMDLLVDSAYGSRRRDNSTSGKISLTFILGAVPKPFQVTANDEIEAKMLAEKQQPDDDTETGTWTMSVWAQDCPGSLTKNGILEIDPGNSWQMKLEYFYYAMVVTEE